MYFLQLYILLLSCTWSNMNHIIFCLCSVLLDDRRLDTNSIFFILSSSSICAFFHPCFMLPCIKFSYVFPKISLWSSYGPLSLLCELVSFDYLCWSCGCTQLLQRLGSMFVFSLVLCKFHNFFQFLHLYMLTIFCLFFTQIIVEIFNLK